MEVAHEGTDASFGADLETTCMSTDVNCVHDATVLHYGADGTESPTEIVRTSGTDAEI